MLKFEAVTLNRAVAVDVRPGKALKPTAAMPEPVDAVAVAVTDVVSAVVEVTVIGKAALALVKFCAMPVELKTSTSALMFETSVRVMPVSVPNELSNLLRLKTYGETYGTAPLGIDADWSTKAADAKPGAVTRKRAVARDVSFMRFLLG